MQVTDAANAKSYAESVQAYKKSLKTEQQPSQNIVVHSVQNNKFTVLKKNSPVSPLSEPQQYE